MKLNNYTSLVAVIRAFCLLVDHLEVYSPTTWLREMNHLLPQIEAGMEQLELEAGYGFFVLPDLDYRFRMFCRLKAFLGDWDEYALPGDGDDGSVDLSGSLADDFTDLYFELRRGLDLYDADDHDPLPSLILWHTGYVLHWEEHLREARRRLERLHRQRVF
ncbi:MAG: hypothetical protein Kow0060_00960 [Methylohalobius crimeensis]